MQPEDPQPLAASVHDKQTSRSHSTNGREDSQPTEQKYRKLRLRFDALKLVRIYFLTTTPTTAPTQASLPSLKNCPIGKHQYVSTMVHNGCKPPEAGPGEAAGRTLTNFICRNTYEPFRIGKNQISACSNLHKSGSKSL